MKTQILHAPDITCDHCERTIKKALGSVPGVHKVEVVILTQEIHLEYDESRVNRADIEAILSREGYPVGGAATATKAGRSDDSCCGSCHL